MKEVEIQGLYQETVDKLLRERPDPMSFTQGYMVLATLNRVLALKGLRAEIGINLVESNGVSEYGN